MGKKYTEEYKKAIVAEYMQSSFKTSIRDFAKNREFNRKTLKAWVLEYEGQQAIDNDKHVSKLSKAKKTSKASKERWKKDAYRENMCNKLQKYPIEVKKAAVKYYMNNRFTTSIVDLAAKAGFSSKLLSGWVREYEGQQALDDNAEIKEKSRINKSSEKNKKIFAVPEHKSKRSKITKELWKNEEYRKKVLSPESRKKSVEGLREYWDSERSNERRNKTAKMLNKNCYKHGTYNGFYYQSSYELAFLKEIDYVVERGDKHFVEYYFEGRRHRYYPDFYLPEIDTIIEIKPFKLLWDKRNKIKFKAAAEKYGDRFMIITEYELEGIKPKCTEEQARKYIK